MPLTTSNPLTGPDSYYSKISLLNGPQRRMMLPFACMPCLACLPFKSSLEKEREKMYRRPNHPLSAWDRTEKGNNASEIQTIRLFVYPQSHSVIRLLAMKDEEEKTPALPVLFRHGSLFLVWKKIMVPYHRHLYRHRCSCSALSSRRKRSRSSFHSAPPCHAL